MLSHRVEVCQRLAGMRHIAQTIDHVAPAMLGKGCQTLVLLGPRDNHVHVLAQHAAKILYTFSFPKTDIIA